MHSEFISGGIFSSNPDNYLKSGYKSSMIDNMYNVTSGTLEISNVKFEDDIDKIFTPTVLIENYQMWEKVLEIFIINEKYVLHLPVH